MHIRNTLKMGIGVGIILYYIEDARIWKKKKRSEKKMYTLLLFK